MTNGPGYIVEIVRYECSACTKVLFYATLINIMCRCQNHHFLTPCQRAQPPVLCNTFKRGKQQHNAEPNKRVEYLIAYRHTRGALADCRKPLVLLIVA